MEQELLDPGAAGVIGELNSGADLTFAITQPRTRESECQIQSSTKTLYLLVVL